MSDALPISRYGATTSNSHLIALVKEDGLFWSILAILSFSMFILCLHASSVYGWHDYYFSWGWYLLLSPLILFIKWANLKTRIDLTLIEIISKFGLGFSLAYNVTPVLLSTPHHFIDSDLLRADQWMHINSLGFLNVTQHHPIFHQLLIYCYLRLEGSFVLLILILSIFKKKCAVNRLLTMSLIALFVAAISFYFFPAFGPATVLKSQLFPHYAAIEWAQYHQVQQGLPLDTQTYFSGFVSMPSIHTFIASLAIYTCFACKELRWYLLPIVAFNILIIASTLFLGEHYFVDLIGAWLLLGILIASYHYANKICRT